MQKATFLTKENYVITGNTSKIGNSSLKITNKNICPRDMNYYMTCPISRSSETMAKCTISANNRGIKS